MPKITDRTALAKYFRIHRSCWEDFHALTTGELKVFMAYFKRTESSRVSVIVPGDGFVAYDVPTSIACWIKFP